ncbi:butyrophilin-like protein 2 [Symphorus nematophorus]
MDRFPAEIESLSCEQKVQGFVGEPVLLPCVLGMDRPLSHYWTDKDDRILLDVKDGAPDVSKQDQRFRGRVDTFPKFYAKGNFSIVLKNVQQVDSGLYDCHIPSEDILNKVSLLVSGKRVEAVEPVETSESSERSGGAAVKPNSLHMILFSLLVSLFCRCSVQADVLDLKGTVWII